MRTQRPFGRGFFPSRHRSRKTLTASNPGGENPGHVIPHPWSPWCRNQGTDHCISKAILRAAQNPHFAKIHKHQKTGRVGYVRDLLQPYRAAVRFGAANRSLLPGGRDRRRPQYPDPLRRPRRRGGDDRRAVRARASRCCARSWPSSSRRRSRWRCWRARISIRGVRSCRRSSTS